MTFFVLWAFYYRINKRRVRLKEEGLKMTYEEILAFIETHKAEYEAWLARQ